MKLLIIVDAQNDFIDGALPAEGAKEAVNNIVSRIKDYEESNEKYFIVFTQDTHFSQTYAKSIEGRKLPIEHCIIDTKGWEISPKIMGAVTNHDRITHVTKTHFGTTKLTHLVADCDEVEFCGFATDICVISNVLTLKSHCPDNHIMVNEKCCAGTSKQAHEAAIQVMKNCQVEVI